MVAATTTAPAVEYLGCSESGTSHVVSVRGESMVVRDLVTHHEIHGREAEPYKIYSRFGKATGCTCPAGRWGKPCKHRTAVEEALKKW